VDVGELKRETMVMERKKALRWQFSSHSELLHSESCHHPSESRLESHVTCFQYIKSRVVTIVTDDLSHYTVHSQPLSITPNGKVKKVTFPSFTLLLRNANTLTVTQIIIRTRKPIGMASRNQNQTAVH
jgi:hypothetical protein